MAILTILVILLEVLMLFNLLIFVHELGHFLAARWRGLKVERFAIWFGKPIWKKTINGVEYVLGSIPAGGYVSLPQMASMEAIEGPSDANVKVLPSISATDKIIVAVAGPLFSFLLALVFAVVVMLVGRPVSEAEATTTIGYVVQDGPGHKAGLQVGDRILEIGGNKITKFGGMGSSVIWQVVRSTSNTLPVKVDRGGTELVIGVTPAKEQTKFWQRKGLRQLQILPAQSALIAEVVQNSPADLAGLKPGDEIVEVNGHKIQHFLAVSDLSEETNGAELLFLIKRPGPDFQFERKRQGPYDFQVKIKPERPLCSLDEKPRLGILWNATGKTRLVHPSAIDLVVSSISEMAETLSALFARDTDIKPQHLGGAVKIMDVYYHFFASENGWRLALWFSVMMNVNLAILNLLPLPVLDGGHIVLALIEGFRRRPLNVRVLNAIQTGFAVILIGFMIYIAFYDVQDLPWNQVKSAPVELKFAPKSTK